MSAALYDVEALRRVYRRGGSEVQAVDHVDLVIGSGELLAIEGTSGSGKSTLLQLLGGLDRPTSGTVRLDGADLAQLSDRELTALRAREIGFVFQHFNLIPTLTARQNVEAAMGPLGLRGAAQRQRALDLLDQVGLSARAHHLPSTMSGGEQQRVAIARALANGPRVLLADEPTGNLDSATAGDVVALLRRLSTDLGVTVVLVTHSAEVAAAAPRRISMRDGRVVGAPATGLAPVLDLSEARSRRDTGRSAGAPGRRAVSVIGRAAAAIAVTGIGAVALHATPAASTSALARRAPAGSVPITTTAATDGPRATVDRPAPGLRRITATSDRPVAPSVAPSAAPPPADPGAGGASPVAPVHITFDTLASRGFVPAVTIVSHVVNKATKSVAKPGAAPPPVPDPAANTTPSPVATAPVAVPPWYSAWMSAGGLSGWPGTPVGTGTTIPAGG